MAKTTNKRSGTRSAGRNKTPRNDATADPPQAAARRRSSNVVCARSLGADPVFKTRTLRRLRKVEGQVRGIHQMVENERRCPEVLEQLSAVQSAVRAIGREVLRSHMKHCAADTLRNAEPRETAATYDELIDLMYRNAR